MSGTGQFRSVRNGSRAGWAAGTAQEHLGDRLAAFVDGELAVDARERVLAHLATCDLCKAEAEEQRRLKNAVADALPPALSAGLLARLQGLPGCEPGDSAGPGGGRGVFGGDVFSRGTAKSYLAPAGEPLGGFPIHEFNRPASRGRRLAFAAAGAFSLAALALGGALPLDAAFEGGGPPEPASGNATSPLSMNRVADQDSADPGVTPVSANVTQPLLAPGGVRIPADSGRSHEGPPNPSPSAQPAAGPLAGGRAAGSPSAATTPTGLPLSAPVLTARAIAPAPLPLLVDIENSAPLSAPLPGGHAR